jgi:hypothetical protein
MRTPLAFLLSIAIAKPCYDTFNGAPFETVCARVVANASASGGLLEVREFVGASAEAYAVTVTVPASVTTYQEALMMGAFYVIDYFTAHGLAASRTVPFTLRPPTPAGGPWLARMALAPSAWPPGGPAPPAPNASNIMLAPLGRATFATLRVVAQQPPQPSDFDALCASLRAALQKELPAWRVDEASPITPTHARFDGELWTGPWEIECQVGVARR